MKRLEAKTFLLLTILLAFSCSEKTTVVVGDPSSRAQVPPGLVIASDKAVDNGKKHLRKGNCNKAIKEFNKALDKDPRNFEALYWLGVAEGMCGHYSRAYDRFLLAFKYSPDKGWQARIYATIGLTLLYKGKDEEAITYFERARIIDPKNEIVIAFYDWEELNKGKGHKKPKIKKKPKDREGFEITLKWLD